jgi:enhancing lycopene biosynthesis protein 2
MEIFNQFKEKEGEKPIACSVLSTLLETLTKRMVASQQITVNILAIKQEHMSESLSNLVAIEKTRAIPTLAYLAGESIAASIHGVQDQSCDICHS